MDSNKYRDLQASKEILCAIEQMGFTEMTEIQQKAIPVMMEGTDIIAKAPTGTGKTCAFGIPIIEKTDSTATYPQALILCPTRELCTQICDELKLLAQFKPAIKIAAVYGGDPIAQQIELLKKGCQIVIATPGRLLDHISHHTINLSHVTVAVLDEADRMLDMGFFKDVRQILDGLHARKQLVMFSATISDQVMDIGWIYQRDAAELTVLPIKENEPHITQYSIQSTGRKKMEDISTILHQNGYQRGLIFCNTKYATVMITDQMIARGFNAECLNGDLKQSDRNKIMAEYKDGTIHFLVATDVAARGIDVSDIEVVFNYDMPQDNDTYLHRIGRTGRAKKEGASYLFYHTEEKARLNNIIRYTHSNILPMAFDEQRQLKPL